MLVAGVVIGMLLSPAVLGRVAPGVYDGLFGSGGSEASRLVAAEDVRIAAELEGLRLTDATDVALREHEARQIEATLPIRMRAAEEQAAGERTRLGWMMALILGAAVVMALESLVSPSATEGERVVVPPTLGRLITARYALIAAWLALAIAQPALLRSLPLVFTALLVGFALLVALVPLGRRVTAS